MRNNRQICRKIWSDQDLDSHHNPLDFLIIQFLIDKILIKLNDLGLDPAKNALLSFLKFLFSQREIFAFLLNQFLHVFIKNAFIFLFKDLLNIDIRWALVFLIDWLIDDEISKILLKNNFFLFKNLFD